MLASRLGGWSARHRGKAVAGWLLLVIVASVLGGLVGTKHLTDHQIGAGDSARADAILDRAGLRDPASEMVLLHSAAPDGWRATATQLASTLAGVSVVTAVQDPVSSADGRDGLVRFDIAGDPDTAADRAKPAFAAVDAVRAAHPDLSVDEVGDASANAWFDQHLGGDFKRAEWTAVPLALGILLVAFGALVAAMVPVVLAVTAFIAALGLLAAVSQVVPVDDSTSSVMLLMGLAVGVDYALFYLRREREERAAGRDADTALAVAAATSGHSVLVSGATVMAAMGGLFLSGMALFEGFAVATILVVLIAMAGSVTVLPAVLSLLGDRVERGRPVDWLRRGRAPRTRRPGRLVNAVLTPVMRRPRLAAGLGVGLLIALALPVTTMHTANLDITQQAPGTPIATAYQRIAAAFPTGPLPAQVVIPGDDPAPVAALRQQIANSPSFGEPVVVTPHQEAGLTVLDVPLAGDGSGARSRAALAELRSDVKSLDTPAYVTGSLAQSIDFDRKLHDGLLPVLGALALVTFAVMARAFRSRVVAGTALVLNLLSVGAAFGVMTAVFQHGWGAGLVGSSGVGAIESWLPMFALVILFGLSTDYHVFVVSRIKEARDAGVPIDQAIREGVACTAGAVTSAAAIMVGVFGVFATLSMQDFKQMGVGLAVAIALDATIIRIVLLPAVMTLLGDRNWPSRSAVRITEESTPALPVG